MMILNKPNNEISTCLIKKNNNLGNLHENKEYENSYRKQILEIVRNISEEGEIEAPKYEIWL